MARIAGLALFLALVCVANAGKAVILGKTSDPCAESLTWGSAACANADCSDCKTENELPLAATTIYLQSSAMRIGNPTAIPTVVKDGKAVTIADPSGQIQINDQICLGTADSCAVVTSCRTVTRADPTAPLSVPLKTSDTDSTDNWNSADKELEDTPRKLCLSRAGAAQNFYLGLRVASVYGCSANTDCANHPANTGNTGAAYPQGITAAQIQELKQRTTCCAGTLTDSLRSGICINTQVQTCCGGIAMETSLDKCCEASSERVRFYNAACPCFSTATSSTGCPSTEPECCLPTKYAELDPNSKLPGTEGQCYHANNHRCCNTGARYDPGTQQCCIVNGLQSLNVPCPCQEDTDCTGGQTAPAGQIATAQTLSTTRCCKQAWPAPMETAMCTKYSNWQSLSDITGASKTAITDGYHPGQNNLYQLQRCFGTCIDTSYQICCNGVACRGEFEKCCNSTCCNRYVGTCAEGRRPGAYGSFSNPREFGIRYEQCTTLENLGPIEAFKVYFLPTFLLAATLLALAMVVIFANNVSARSYSFVERGMIIVAVLLILFALPLFFSPAYKYGLLVVLTALITILSAAARVRWLNILALGAVILLLLFLFDPFSGNRLFNFSLDRNWKSLPERFSSGLIHTISSYYRDGNRCTMWYNYFMLDPLLQDVERWDNPSIWTFGYCARGWLVALLVFAAILLVLALLLFLLTLIALVLRFRKQKYEPIELEVRALPE